MMPIYKIQNPSLSRKMFWFGLTSLVLIYIMWVANLIALGLNLLMTDMLWPEAVIIFCVAWLTIYSIQRVIMAPIGRRLSRAVTAEYRKSMQLINDDFEQQLDTIEYLRNRKGTDDE